MYPFVLSCSLSPTTTTTTTATVCRSISCGRLFVLLAHATDIAQNYQHDTKVVEFVPPHELLKRIDFSLPAQGTPLDADLSAYDGIIQDVLKYSIRTGSPRYFNQLWSGNDIACIIAEMISVFTNSSTYTYEVAPVYSLYAPPT
jgi:hypothetical protein